MAITNIQEQLARDEEDRSLPYDDATGKTLVPGMTLEGNLTIGTGINLSEGLDQVERDFIFQRRLTKAQDAVRARFPWSTSLSDARLGVLENMAFNMGIERLAQFVDFLAKLKAGDFSGAKSAMLNSRWAKQVGPRAIRLSLQIESGLWQ